MKFVFVAKLRTTGGKRYTVRQVYYRCSRPPKKAASRCPCARSPIRHPFVTAAPVPCSSRAGAGAASFSFCHPQRPGGSFGGCWPNHSGYRRARCRSLERALGEPTTREPESLRLPDHLIPAAHVARCSALTEANTSAPRSPPEVTILIPAYNEEARLGRTLDGVLGHPSLQEAQIVVVDDGSTDATVHVALDRLRDRPGAHILASPSNKGKGSAIRKGVVVSRGRKVIFMDADLATSLEAIDPMIERLDHADVVIGSRRAPGAVVTGRSRRAPSCTTPSAPGTADRRSLGLRSAVRLQGFRAEVGHDLFRRSMFDGFSRSTRDPPHRREDRPADRGDPHRLARRGWQQGPHPARPAGDGRRPCARALSPPRHRTEPADGCMTGAAVRTSQSVGVLAWRDLANPRAGGSEVVVDQYLRGLHERGHDVRLLLRRTDRERSYPVHRIGGTYNTQYLRAPLAHLKLLRHTDVLLDVQNGIPFFAPLWRRRPTVCLVHHVHTEQWAQHFPAPWPPSVARWSARRCPGPTRERRTCGVSGHGPRSRRPRHPERPDHRRAQRRRVREPAAARSPEPLFVALGRLVPHKRIDLLLQMWERVRPHTGGRLVIAGDGPELPRLRGLAGEAVEFTGSISEEEKARLLSSAGCSCTRPSHEGWGMVVLEAGMVRTPTLAFEVAGLRDNRAPWHHRAPRDGPGRTRRARLAARCRRGDARPARPRRAREWRSASPGIARSTASSRCSSGPPMRRRPPRCSRPRRPHERGARHGRGGGPRRHGGVLARSMAVGVAAFLILAAVAHAGGPGELAAASAVISLSFVLAVVPGAIQLRAAADVAAGRPASLPRRFLLLTTLGLAGGAAGRRAARRARGEPRAPRCAVRGGMRRERPARRVHRARRLRRREPQHGRRGGSFRIVGGIALGVWLGATGLAAALLLGSLGVVAISARSAAGVPPMLRGVAWSARRSRSVCSWCSSTSTPCSCRLLGADSADAYAVASLPVRGIFFALFTVSWLAVPVAVRATRRAELLRARRARAGAGRPPRGLPSWSCDRCCRSRSENPAPSAPLLALLLRRRPRSRPPSRRCWRWRSRGSSRRPGPPPPWRASPSSRCSSSSARAPRASRRSCSSPSPARWLSSAGRLLRLPSAHRSPPTGAALLARR